MKKVLFLAIAALAYVGAANAQGYTPVSKIANAADTVANKVNFTTIMEAGYWGTNFRAPLTPITAGDIYAPTSALMVNKIRMTTGGNYKFAATASNWTRLVGTSWTSLFEGSMFEFKGGTVFSFTEAGGAVSNDGISGLLADSTGVTTAVGTLHSRVDSFALLIKASKPAVVGPLYFTFQEHMIKLGADSAVANLGNANNLGCGADLTVNVDTVTSVRWANTTADLKVDTTAICKSAIAISSSTVAGLRVKIELQNNTKIDTFFIGAKIEPKNPLTSPLTGSKVLIPSSAINFAVAANAGDGSLAFDVFKMASDVNGLGGVFTGVLPGIYTFTLFRATDNIASNSTDAAALGILPANKKSVDFAILPAPRPTLTTSTVK